MHTNHKVEALGVNFVADEDYQRGLVDGEIKALGVGLKTANARIDKVEPRITALERVMYSGLGIVFLIQLLPTISELLE